ncbi:MAG: tRNA (adenosine(37)-N6)-threonylcarbamoyltransferase complex transferase subunit TsaD [Oscillospiraceae bacterium]|jgi:N6-L-threonylcarbamoyladenine synthase|nr:tRNA (adenosine(37)-N6)-threonylcarbamoyltransferase complex transferase subunit TsaD [Oscillospiraceae bacterium]
MIILSAESSCDDTSVAVTEDGRKVLSNAVSSQTDIHVLYGGVVPELASRSHIRAIMPLADRAMAEAGVSKADVDAVAVTYAPGLIGAVLVGVNFAKAAAAALNVPLIPVHHIRGHIAANYIAHPSLCPPFVCLVASGGSSMIVDVRGYTDMRVLGSTRDDAAGECFDKAARVLGIGYPGGAQIDALARSGDPSRYKLPRSRVAGNPYDISFSGLKTAVVNLAHNAAQKGERLDLSDLAASLCAAVSDTLVSRAMDAALELGYGKLAFAGGVAANSMIRSRLSEECGKNGVELFLSPAELCGDNAAMIGCQGYYEYLAGVTADSSLNAYATMSPDSGYIHY